jgi:DNA-directed RNA polymerase subunit RPC12/RpoP
MSNSATSVLGLVEKYRIKVYCFNCGASYVTRLLKKTRPRKCKVCGSTKLNLIDRWRIDW